VIVLEMLKHITIMLASGIVIFEKIWINITD